MDLIKWSIQVKWPLLLLEIIFLFGGMILIISGFKMRKKSRATAIVSVLTGIVITLVTLYILLYTIVFGYNS